MKKALLLIAIVVLTVFAFSACRSGESESVSGSQGGGGQPAGDTAAIPEGGFTGNLRVWSFTDEAERQATVFQGMHPNLNVEFSMVGMTDGAYTDWLLSALAAGGANAPDVFYLEASIARLFVEGPFVQNLNALVPLAHEIGTYQFTMDVGTHDGEVRAFSWQATPGVMYYRRSLAREYFGTDDPVELQRYFSDIDTALDSARRIRDMSGGTSFFISSANEFNNAFLSARTQPWVVNNTLTIDPVMKDFMSFSRMLRDEGLEAQVGTWGEGWFASMTDNLRDAAGNQNNVFAYLLPTWGLTHVIQGAAAGVTDGDWGIIPGPLPYSGGGTWIAVNRNSQNLEAAMEFIRSTVLNEYFLEGWALGRFDNDYLRAIDPSIPAGVAQPGGDFVSSARVVENITPMFDTGPTADFLSGQNAYAAFGLVAPNVNLSLIQGTDHAIYEAFNAARSLYVDGQVDFDGAWDSFRDSVQMALPTLNW